MTAPLLPHVKTFLTVRTEGIQITLYCIMSYISLVRHCCFYWTMVCI